MPPKIQRRILALGKFPVLEQGIRDHDLDARIQSTTEPDHFVADVMEESANVAVVDIAAYGTDPAIHALRMRGPGMPVYATHSEYNEVLRDAGSEIVTDVMPLHPLRHCTTWRAGFVGLPDITADWFGQYCRVDMLQAQLLRLEGRQDFLDSIMEHGPQITFVGAAARQDGIGNAELQDLRERGYCGHFHIINDVPESAEPLSLRDDANVTYSTHPVATYRVMPPLIDQYFSFD